MVQFQVDTLVHHPVPRGVSRAVNEVYIVVEVYYTIQAHNEFTVIERPEKIIKTTNIIKTINILRYGKLGARGADPHGIIYDLVLDGCKWKIAEDHFPGIDIEIIIEQAQIVVYRRLQARIAPC